MRTEKEMMDLIINFAKQDERIRGVLMNGSRVNPNIEKDIFQDFDIVYLVNDVEPFKDEDYVVPYLGEIMIMQKPEDMILPPPIGDGHYTYLMQFTDGNRIDISFININQIEEQIEDSLTKVLLDKDDIIPYLSEPSEESYRIQKPNPKLYDDCCNEFIWGMGSHIPKTIWRKELPLLKELIEIVLRKPLIKMLEWSIGIKIDYAFSIGKGGKNLEKLLEPEVWHKYKKTYADYQYKNIWESLFIFHDLFKETAEHVGENCGFEFPEDELERAFSFLKHVKELPENAESIF
ncbi:aminoglycoside 6-adenylyltransferase [Clostridium sp. D2Q-11]|uniref:Aminoglycoside 6-adenylyltransferase n=1 Tax=Anaeromonas frigoriresistens TaxID=2683708 RepID=A0A942Z5P3_9FIRM|nr:aminoglycoside 6-adenylyltransferase [Anaeromonas frigoriresistens]MBS4537651.1 aminoglycoside 6-adenylyltransferase [Anaeromonas frigoriresistens]